MQYYLATKRNEVLIHATTCVNLETLCEMKEVRNKRSHIIQFHLYEMFRIGNIYSIDSYTSIMCKGRKWASDCQWLEMGVASDC